MAINVQHGDPLILGRLARQAGRGKRQQQLEDQALQVGLQQAALDERARQFDLGLDQRAYESAAGRQLQRQELDQRAAASAFRDRTALQRQAAEQQFRAQQNQVDFEQQAQLESARDTRDFSFDNYDSLNEQANLALKELREQRAKMSPEGVTETNRLHGGLREIQSAIGNTVRPDQAPALYEKWWEDYYRTNPQQYVKTPQTPEEWYGETTYTAPDGAVYGKDRSGMPRKLQDPKPAIPTQEELDAGTRVLPDGSRVSFNPYTGEQISPPKAEKPAKGVLGPEGDLPQEDFDAQYDAARKRLIDQRNLEQEYDANNKPKPIKAPTRDEIIKEMDDFNSIKRERYYGSSGQAAPSELQGQGAGLGGLSGGSPESIVGVDFGPIEPAGLGVPATDWAYGGSTMPDDIRMGGEGGDPSTEDNFTIIGPNPAGLYAKKYADGRVELLPEGYAP